MTQQIKPVYRHKDDHRIPKWNWVNKSKWIVSIKEEEDIFNTGYSENWFFNNDIWSLKYTNDNLCVIGEDHRPEILKKGQKYAELVVAKFIVDQGCWHGYPVNPLTDPPDSSLLTVWSQTPGIPKRKIMKIHTVR